MHDTTEHSSKPNITVLMPVYNTPRNQLTTAIESILSQTYKDFIFLIIDDGSNDETKKTLEYFQNKDQRVQIITNSVNHGLIYCLNKGLAEAKTKWIARMDSDDWSFPSRLEKQIQYLKENPSISVLATQAIWMDTGRAVEKRSIFKKPDIISTLPFYCCIVHPTVVLNREHILSIGGYPQKPFIEDYALWIHICFDTDLDIQILPSECLKYRRSTPVEKYKKYNSQQITSTHKLIDELWNRLLQNHQQKFIKSEELEHELSRVDALASSLSLRLPKDYSKKILRENVLRAKKEIIKRHIRSAPLLRKQFLYAAVRYFFIKVVIALSKFSKNI